MKTAKLGTDMLSGEPCWIYTDISEPPKVGDTIGFSCNGKGRGGHYQVTARITKVNRKTIDAVEALRSYRPGTEWRVNKDLPSILVYK